MKCYFSKIKELPQKISPFIKTGKWDTRKVVCVTLYCISVSAAIAGVLAVALLTSKVSAFIFGSITIVSAFGALLSKSPDEDLNKELLSLNQRLKSLNDAALTQLNTLKSEHEKLKQEHKTQEQSMQKLAEEKAQLEKAKKEAENAGS